MELLEKEKIGQSIVIGPTCMMKFVSSITKRFSVKTTASLNPIMVDGTGMCGVCRVMVDGNTKFACVDGPAFDAHMVNWEWLMARRCTYSSNEEEEPNFQCRHCAQW